MRHLNFLPFAGSSPVDSSHFTVQLLKGVTSRLLRAKFPETERRVPHLWIRSYYCESAGRISFETFQRNIEDQKKQQETASTNRHCRPDLESSHRLAQAVLEAPQLLQADEATDETAEAAPIGRESAGLSRSIEKACQLCFASQKRPSQEFQ